MLADEFPDMNVRSPKSYGGSPVSIHLYVEDVDAFAKRATGAGAKLVRPVADQSYGDRHCQLEDPFGHVWMISTHKEHVSPEEMRRRAAALYGSKSLRTKARGRARPRAYPRLPSGDTGELGIERLSDHIREL